MFILMFYESLIGSDFEKDLSEKIDCLTRLLEK